MHVDIEQLARWVGAVSAIISFFALIIQPFRVALKQNEKTMGNLEKAINQLQSEIQLMEMRQSSTVERSKENRVMIEANRDSIHNLQTQKVDIQRRLQTLEERK